MFVSKPTSAVVMAVKVSVCAEDGLKSFQKCDCQVVASKLDFLNDDVINVNRKCARETLIISSVRTLLWDRTSIFG